MIQNDHHYRYDPQHFDMKLFIHTVLLYFFMLDSSYL